MMSINEFSTLALAFAEATEEPHLTVSYCEVAPQTLSNRYRLMND